jgi:DNA topoisomerase-1
VFVQIDTPTGATWVFVRTEEESRLASPEMFAADEEDADRAPAIADAEFNEEDHPRAEDGKFGSGGASHKSLTNPSDDQMETWTTYVESAVADLEAKGEDDADDPHYNALAHMATALEYENTVKLSRRQFRKFAAVEQQNGEPAAAGWLELSQDKKTAEITNVGSIAKGAGAAVVKSLIDQARSVGVRKITLTSTAGTYYERFGFKSVGGSKMELDLTKIRTDDAEFVEEDHPRDEDGKFGSGSGSSNSPKARLEPTKTNRAGERTTASGAPLPKHIASLKIPPAWSDVHYASSPNASLLVAGRDGLRSEKFPNGRPVAIYSDSHHAAAAASKFARVKELSSKFDRIKAQNDKARRDPKTRDVADCLALVMQMGIRPGSSRDTGAAVQAYGATTLEGRHVRVSPTGKVSLQFTGKKGVALNLRVDDDRLAAQLVRRKSKAGPKGHIFGDVTPGLLRAHAHAMDGGGFTTKDFRTNIGTTTATKLVSERDVPTDAKSYKKAVMDVARVVSAKLGNTPAMALQAYINPAVFAPWRATASI